MRFRHALAITVVIQGLTLAVSMAFTLLASRWLGVTGRGMQSLLTSAAQVCAMVLGLGFPNAIPSLVGGDPGRAASAMRTQALILAAATAVLAVAALVNHVAHVFVPVIGLEFTFALLVIATIAHPAYATIALTVGKTWQFNLAALLTSLAGLVILAIGYALHSIDVSFALAAQAVGFLAGLTYVLLTLRPLLRRRGLAVSAKLGMRPSRIAVYGFLSTLFALLAFRGDIVLVTILGGGLRAAGVYSLASFTAEMFLKIPGWIAQLLTPRVAAQPEQASRQTVRLMWFSVGLSAAFLGAFWLVGDYVRVGIQAIVGKDYVEAYTLVGYMSPRIVMQSAGIVLAGNLAGRGYTPYSPVALFLGMVGVWAFDVVLIPRYGLVGAGLATSLGHVPAFVTLFMGFLRYNDTSMAQFLGHSMDMWPGGRRGVAGRRENGE